MILQKLASAIRRQDWFQVLIEVLIVIVGLYLGLQVTQWSDDRADRQRESDYLDQLHTEVELEERIGTVFYGQAQYTFETLQKKQNQYRDTGTFGEFNMVECNAVLMSSVYNNFFPEVNTLNEMEAAGNSLIISDQNIRGLLSRYKNRMDSTDIRATQVSLTTIMLDEKYPELVLSKGADFDITDQTDNQCDMELIDKSPGFKNDLVRNIQRFRAYMSPLARQYDTLIELHNALDARLSITHGEEG